MTSDAGGGRRVLYRHRSEPIKVAQSYLAALAADWDGSLEAVGVPGRPARLTRGKAATRAEIGTLVPMTNLPSSDVLTVTRESLHRAAEHLLAAAHKRATGQITLVPADNGVATPPLPDGRVVAIEGTDVVVRVRARSDGRRSRPWPRRPRPSASRPASRGPSTDRAPTTSPHAELASTRLRRPRWRAGSPWARKR